MRARPRTVLALAVVQAAVLVLAHNLVYLARYGSRFGEALVHGGHGDAWQAAATTSLVLGGLVALVAIARLVVLHLMIRRANAFGRTPRLRAGRLLRTWLRVGPALATSTVVLLTIQENVEQAAIRGTSSGPGILLTPEYAGGLWIALAAGLLVGLVVALLGWRIAALEARLRAIRTHATHRRPGRAARPVIVVDRPARTLLGRGYALRAPPAVLPA